MAVSESNRVAGSFFESSLSSTGNLGFKTKRLLYRARSDSKRHGMCPCSTARKRFPESKERNGNYDQEPAGHIVSRRGSAEPGIESPAPLGTRAWEVDRGQSSRSRLGTEITEIVFRGESGEGELNCESWREGRESSISRGQVEVEARQEECGSWECGARSRVERRGGTTRGGERGSGGGVVIGCIGWW